jgi:subtilisin family serine protease
MEVMILRSNKPQHGNVPIAAVQHASGELAIDKANLSDRQLLDAQRDPSNVAVAPPMPVYLIDQVEASGAAAGALPAVSWGIETVGALRSPWDGAGVTVAVLDTGIRKDHPAFKDDNLKIEAQNFTEDGDDADTNGHGTHCAGTIFGRDVDRCRIGVARGITKVLIGKVLSKKSGSTEAILKGVHWAWGQGAQVISMSLGIDYVGYRQRLVNEYRYADAVATSMALAGYRANVRVFDRLSQYMMAGGPMRGAILVAATGNESHREIDPKFRVTVSPPAAADLFVAVGAVSQAASAAQCAIANFSNIGARLVAPGVGILSASKDGGLALKSGTSMATPHVAGVAALWTQKLKAESRPFGPADVVHEMEKSVLRLSNSDVSDVGLGLVQAPAAA